MPLTDDEFFKNGKPEVYKKVIEKLHEEIEGKEKKEVIYEFDFENESEEE